MRFYSASQIGIKRSLTPDGFLVCEDVPIARTGMQLYADHELPHLKPAHDKIIKVYRDAEQVFTDQAIASFAGKPVTNDHPTQKVTPETWRTHAVGVVLNPRRGDGAAYDRDFLYADLLIHDAAAIADILAGKREVSAGYDADYDQRSPGEAHQFNIVGNHVALVDRGRCGGHCAIGDHEMPKTTVRDRIMQVARTGNMDALRTVLDESFGRTAEVDPPAVAEPDDDRDKREHHVTVNVHGGTGAQSTSPAADQDVDPGAAAGGGGDVNSVLSEITARLDRIEQAIVLLANNDEGGAGDETGNGATGDGTRDDAAGSPPTDDPEQKPGKGEPERERMPMAASDQRGARRRTTDHSPAGDGRFVGDSTSLKAEFADAIARAEILRPGARMPTFDAKQPAKATFDTLCSFRRNVLDEALRSDNREHVVAVCGIDSPNPRAMTCDAVTAVFNASSEMTRRANNQRIGSTATYNAGKPPTIAEINAKNRARYGIVA